MPDIRAAARGALALVMVAVLGAASSGLRAQSQRARSAGEAVIVIPFVNISGNPADEWLGAGIAETVTADLDQVSGLSVIGVPARMTELDRRADADQSALEVARDLDASWVVSGGFQRVGEELRITARLTEVETGTARSTVKLDGLLEDLFVLQDQIVGELRSGFGASARSDAAAAAPATPATRGSEEATAAVAPAPVAPTEGEGVAPAPVGTVSGGRGPGPLARGAPGPRPPVERSEGALPPNRPPSVTAPVPAVRDTAPGRDDGDPRAPRPAGDVTGRLTLGDARPAVGTAAGAGALTGRVSVEPLRAQTPPSVDGRLDDAIWQRAARVTDFVQQEPLDGAPASERTEVYIAYDSSNIYLGFYAHYEDPGIMRANRSDRDEASRSDDTFSVYFDPFLDQQRAYVFSVNGYGVQGDSIVGSRGGGGGFGGGGRGRGGGGPRGGVPRGDDSWDALFSTGGQIVEDGFTAEMAIPFKSLRYPARGGDIPHTWGFQIVRSIRDKDETVVWSPVSRDVAGFLPQMGVLSGMTGLSTSRNLEIQPVFTGVQFGTLNRSTGQVVDDDPQPEAGANIKYGVTSNLTADFTINPDFSQIESDRPQVEVNQRFALFFPELRPFFLEGAEIFDIPGPFTTVHTRTIVDPAYGAKLTGKAGNTTVGVLYANDEAPGNLDDPLNPAFGESAQTFVGRVRYDLYSESFVGAIVTDREFLGGYSRLVGIDSNFRVGNTHTFAVRAMGTDHRDQEGLDSTGHFLDVMVRKSGRNLSYTAAHYHLSPDFKTDVGFVRRTDQRFVFGNINYNWWPQHWLISWGPSARYSRNHNFEGTLEDEQTSLGVNLNFAKNIGGNVDVSRDMERYEGIDFFKTRVNAFARINTSRLFSIGGGINRGDQVYFDRANPFLGTENSIFMFMNLRPISRFQSQININTSRFIDSNNRFIPGLNEGEIDENGQVFDVKIFRALSTYQFTDRWLFRNIAEFNTFNKTMGFNFLLTYRLNSGTAFYIGYDDRYQQREQFNDQELFPGSGYQQTNRAVFTKFQYLFRF